MALAYMACRSGGALMLALIKGIKRLLPNDDGQSSSDRYKYLRLVAVWDKAVNDSGPICTHMTSDMVASHPTDGCLSGSPSPSEP